MERFNREIRGREKTMKGLKMEETPILRDHQILHNYIMAHEGLEGKTRAKLAGSK
jgi:hypothetical protein